MSNELQFVVTWKTGFFKVLEAFGWYDDKLKFVGHFGILHSVVGEEFSNKIRIAAFMQTP